MKKFAVGFYSLFTNELKVEIIEAEDWYSAMMKHSGVKDFELPATSLEKAKEEMFNCDAGIDVVEIV